MHPPPVYNVPNGHVCKLNVSLYGLKHASRQWNAKLTQTLLRMGFQQSWHDYSLFVKNYQVCLLLLFVYVDDILVISSNQKYTVDVKQALHDFYKIKILVMLDISWGGNYQG